MQTLNLSNRFLWATSRGNKPWQQTRGQNHMITMTMIFTKLSGRMTTLFGGFFHLRDKYPKQCDTRQQFVCYMV